MRTFIAIELPKEIKTALSRLQEQLKKSEADVNWVEPQNIHLTLKFLGERDYKKISIISAITEEIVQDKAQFTASITSIGAFPSINSPRVIWAGINKGDAQIKEIAAELEEKIAKAGIPKEDRPFSSHITIGRMRSVKNLDKLIQEINKIAAGFDKQNLEFSVKSITLFKSTLSSKGPTYEVLKEASLITS